jgi:hypothetical protein
MAGNESRNEGETETTPVGEIDVEEVGCEEEASETLEGHSPPVDYDTTLPPEEEADLDRTLADPDAVAPSAAATRHAPPGLGPAGGGFGGSEAPIKRALRIGTRNGLTITSLKRPPGVAASTSDHHRDQRTSFAADMSNGSSPTPEMDRTARQIATRLGHPEFRAGNLRVTLHGYRVQLLWRTDIGGNHFNHVHVGVRML